MIADLYPAHPLIPCRSCVSPGSCKLERECYIWRCENPHAPRKDESLLGEFAELMLKVIAARFEY